MRVYSSSSPMPGTPLSHPAFQSKWNKPSKPAAADAPPTPFGPAVSPVPSVNLNFTGTNIRADLANQVQKSMKDNHCPDKIFSGEEEPVSEKFLNWLSNLSEEAIAVDARLADWFSLAIFDYDREQKLTVEYKEADGQIFTLIKKFLTGSALLQVEAMKAHRSGRTCVMDLAETHMQDFSGEAAKLQEQIDNMHFSEDVNPTNELVRIITVVSKLALVQQHRKRPGPDIHDICLKVVKTLQPYSIYAEIKLAESTNPGMPELHDLYLLRTWCNVRYTSSGYRTVEEGLSPTSVP